MSRIGCRVCEDVRPVAVDLALWRSRNNDGGNGEGVVASLSKLWARGRALPWAVVWEVGRSLWFNSRDRVSENLSARERKDFAAIVRKGRGRPWNLDDKERRQLVALVKKAATGESDSSWNQVGTSLLTLLPPRLLNEIWKRRPRR
jgi:hypothetical protein